MAKAILILHNRCRGEGAENRGFTCLTKILPHGIFKLPNTGTIRRRIAEDSTAGRVRQGR
ncbi:hypothetical protein [Lawsonibacter hominis]|uniref:Uncharacterized protein n=1 Tax=Lawsonibacter hominis TaxID=2763053 RepID=A0A8J6MAB3_9FIRM|nr:hypothetical protein [Lawsonibacter hominis]MBC5733579.1 hypothetical protein [Lawsonibacter hominis]MCI6399952.1 hypothetical protein [Lawsonibacter sp.]